MAADPVIPAADFRQARRAVRKSFWQVYWPLALSWFFMGWEGQVAVGLIGLMPENEVLQAGVLVVWGLAMLVESPVIDLLSTATTLGTDRVRYAQISKFAGILMLWVTVVHSLVVFTPAYHVVAVEWMGNKPEVADAARDGLFWMPLWAACVGWRRYRQGIMIRAESTRPISIGTLIRVVTTALVGGGLYLSKALSGMSVVGAAFAAAVFAEALYIHFASAKVIHALPDDRGEPPMGLAKLFRFHLPLTASTLLMLTTPFLMARALNQTADPIIAMAAWQVAGTVAWLFETATFALPEAVIARYRPGDERTIAMFCLAVGGALSGGMLATHVTGLDRWIFETAYHSKPEVANQASIAFLWTSPLPLLVSAQSFFRGMLTAHHITSARMAAILVGLAAMGLVLQAGLKTSLPGVVVGALGVLSYSGVELAILAGTWARSARKPPLGPDLSQAQTEPGV
ncbi:MAG: hypothetical protein JSS71_12250 [Armatimonadetes bacterium]|nr:hypothetical protein [Armatimonadota bacterium]MBX3109205.1 hypothetical protein [Fimbriimonadaceae bacterium]